MSDNLILISLSLQDFGYRVVTATNGADALNVAKLAHPDLILMDIAMPQQDGLAATRRIREESELQDVPVVALTAFDTDGFRQAAFDAGFNGYLTKPIDFDRLQKLIASCSRATRGTRRASEACTRSVYGVQSPPVPPPAPRHRDATASAFLSAFLSKRRVRLNRRHTF